MKIEINLNIDEYTQIKNALFHEQWDNILPQSFMDWVSPEWFRKTRLDAEKLHGAETYIVKDNGVHGVTNNGDLNGGSVDNICGVVMLSRLRDEGARKDDGEIATIYFFKKYHGKGYAQSAMKFAENRLRELGYKDIYLWALEINARARRFYEKNGYVLTGKARFQDCGKPYKEVQYIKDSQCIKK